MTYEQVISRLEAIELELERLMPNEVDRHPAAEYHRAKHEYKRAWAEAHLRTQGTVDERNNQTVLKLYGSKAYKDLVVAEAAYEGNKATIDLLESRASIGQSLLRSMTREAVQTGRQPQWSRQAVA